MADRVVDVRAQAKLIRSRDEMRNAVRVGRTRDFGFLFATTSLIGLNLAVRRRLVGAPRCGWV